MPKKIEEIKIEEILQEEKPIEEKVVTEEEDYFFPDKRITVKATSLEEAIKKVNQNE